MSGRQPASDVRRAVVALQPMDDAASADDSDDDDASAHPAPSPTNAVAITTAASAAASSSSLAAAAPRSNKPKSLDLDTKHEYSRKRRAYWNEFSQKVAFPFQLVHLSTLGGSGGGGGTDSGGIASAVSNSKSDDESKVVCTVLCTAIKVASDYYVCKMGLKCTIHLSVYSPAASRRTAAAAAAPVVRVYSEQSVGANGLAQFLTQIRARAIPETELCAADFDINKLLRRFPIASGFGAIGYVSVDAAHPIKPLKVLLPAWFNVTTREPPSQIELPAANVPAPAPSNLLDPSSPAAAHSVSSTPSARGVGNGPALAAAAPPKRNGASRCVLLWWLKSSAEAERHFFASAIETAAKLIDAVPFDMHAHSVGVAEVMARLGVDAVTALEAPSIANTISGFPSELAAQATRFVRGEKDRSPLVRFEGGSILFCLSDRLQSAVGPGVDAAGVLAGKLSVASPVAKPIAMNSAATNVVSTAATTATAATGAAGAGATAKPSKRHRNESTAAASNTAAAAASDAPTDDVRPHKRRKEPAAVSTASTAADETDSSAKKKKAKNAADADSSPTKLKQSTKQKPAPVDADADAIPDTEQPKSKPASNPTADPKAKSLASVKPTAAAPASRLIARDADAKLARAAREMARANTSSDDDIPVTKRKDTSTTARAAAAVAATKPAAAKPAAVKPAASIVAPKPTAPAIPAIASTASASVAKPVPPAAAKAVPAVSPPVAPTASASVAAKAPLSPSGESKTTRFPHHKLASPPVLPRATPHVAPAGAAAGGGVSGVQRATFLPPRHVRVVHPTPPGRYRVAPLPSAIAIKSDAAVAVAAAPANANRQWITTNVTHVPPAAPPSIPSLMDGLSALETMSGASPSASASAGDTTPSTKAANAKRAAPSAPAIAPTAAPLPVFAPAPVTKPKAEPRSTASFLASGDRSAPVPTIATAAVAPTVTTPLLPVPVSSASSSPSLPVPPPLSPPSKARASAAPPIRSVPFTSVVVNLPPYTSASDVLTAFCLPTGVSSPYRVELHRCGLPLAIKSEPRHRESTETDSASAAGGGASVRIKQEDSPPTPEPRETLAFVTGPALLPPTINHSAVKIRDRVSVVVPWDRFSLFCWYRVVPDGVNLYTDVTAREALPPLPDANANANANGKLVDSSSAAASAEAVGLNVRELGAMVGVKQIVEIHQPARAHPAFGHAFCVEYLSHDDLKSSIPLLHMQRLPSSTTAAAAGRPPRVIMLHPCLEHVPCEQRPVDPMLLSKVWSSALSK